MTINYQNLEKINLVLNQHKPAKLLIVSKNQSTNDIIELLEQGYNYFGENRVQEANKKFTQEIRKKYSNLNLNLIGPLQSNKTKQALQTFDTIQSLDRKKIIDEIFKVKMQLNEDDTITENFYLQVNIGLEDQKSGLHPEKVKDMYSYALAKGLNIVGLMCIPPIGRQSDFYFKKMVALKNQINPKILLSMGMSSDYENALVNGSDLIRVGSKIFQ